MKTPQESAQAQFGAIGPKTKTEAINVTFKMIGEEAGTANLFSEFRIPEHKETSEMKIK